MVNVRLSITVLAEIIYINIFRSFDQMATMPIYSKTKYV